MTSSSPSRSKVFISYSRNDEKALQRLRMHLKPYEDQGLDVWADTSIKPGSSWQQEINTALDSARVAVLLVSAEYLASKNKEIELLLQAAEENKVRILPVILGASAFALVPGLGDIQALNDLSRPISGLNKAEQDSEWEKIAQGIFVAWNGPVGTPSRGLHPAPAAPSVTSSAPASLPIRGPSGTRRDPRQTRARVLLASLILVLLGTLVGVGYLVARNVGGDNPPPPDSQALSTQTALAHPTQTIPLTPSPTVPPPLGDLFLVLTIMTSMP